MKGAAAMTHITTAISASNQRAPCPRLLNHRINASIAPAAELERSEPRQIRIVNDIDVLFTKLMRRGYRFNPARLPMAALSHEKTCSRAATTLSVPKKACRNIPSHHREHASLSGRGMFRLRHWRKIVNLHVLA